jgi:hypothetical protein
MRYLPVFLALSAIVATPALAQDLPTRKPGLWEMKMVYEGRNLPATSMRQCTDQATDKLMHANFGGAAQDVCPDRKIQRSGNTITIDATCKFGGGAMTTKSHSVITGSFDSAYTVKVISTRTGGPAVPGMPPGGETHMTIEAKYLGPCEAGQQPGDMIMSNGMKMNVKNMPKVPGMGASDSMIHGGGMTPKR